MDGIDTELFVKALKITLEQPVREHLEKMRRLEAISETLEDDETIYCPWVHAG